MQLNKQLNTVRAKFLIVLIPLFILSFVILSGISYYVANNALLKGADEIARGVGDKFALQIDKNINEKMIRLDELASSPVIIQGDDAAKIQVLAEAKKRSPEFDMLCFTDLNGVAINEVGARMERGDREYIKKVKETKKPYVSNPSVSGTTGKLITILARPVINNGNLVGYVFGTISLDNISKLMEQVKYEKTGYGYLVDSSGIILGHGSRPDLAGKLNLTEKKVNSEIKDFGTELDARLMSNFKAVVESGQQISSEYVSPSGVELVTVMTPIALDGRHWVMVVTAPKAEVQEEASLLFKVMSVISNFFIVLAIVVIYFFAKRISKPIEAIRDECVVLNDGDLRQNHVSVNSKDEIGQLAKSFNEMRKTLRGLIQKVQDQSQQVAAASEELTAGAQQSAEAANQVATSITDIAQGVEKQSAAADGVNGVAKNFSSSAEQISVKAQGIVEIAKVTSQNAGQGREAIAKAVDEMQQIGEGSEAIQQAITKLDKGSQEIGNIVALISNIAGQTNLLALNAAIEAARAGEAGRGFAVVAEEVRKLAEESNQSSQKIGELVKRNLLDMQAAVVASKAGTERVAVGIGAVKS
ncbi:MAG: methyl-accepting chemotaxis sensory transducer with Cache sensor, partial [Firmicutes bacterium]|nr:methyl-accepting chemotaxis sensory transducer with Cache sensor [Bacillota bacterium]